MPLATLKGLCIVDAEGVAAFMKQLINAGYWMQPGPLLLTCFILLIFQAIASFFLNLHIRLQYGQYLKELKKLMDDLEMEE